MFSLFAPQKQPYILVIMVAIYYAIIPLVLYVIHNEQHYLTGFLVGIVGCLFILFGLITASFVGSIRCRVSKFFPSDYLVYTIFILFFVFLVLVYVTSESIPLHQALTGASSDEVAMSRENFLKARTGWQAVFIYINALLAGSFLPFVLMLSFYEKRRARWLVFVIFFLYSVSFMEKAFFLKCVLPMLSFYALKRDSKISMKRYLLILIVPVILFVNSIVAGFGAGNEHHDTLGTTNYFNAGYVTYANDNPLEFILWRIVAVPVFTYIDSLVYFENELSGRLLNGSTSSFLSILFGFEKIHYERLVFEYQWGQNNSGTGSANSTYLAEAYVNYGYFGVMFFSYTVGVICSLMSSSKNVALSSLSILFSIAVFTGGLIGTLLSNGYLLLFIVCYILKVKHTYQYQYESVRHA